MKAVWIPTRAELDELHRTGQLPLEVGTPLEVREAARLVAQLPPVTHAEELMPSGYGLLPPRGAEPWIRLRTRVQEAYGRQIIHADTGVLGCMWRRGERVVFRLWFRSNEVLAGAAVPELRGPVDVYEDAIRSVKGLAGVVPHLTGWMFVRLDADPPVQ